MRGLDTHCAHAETGWECQPTTQGRGAATQHNAAQMVQKGCHESVAWFHVCCTSPWPEGIPSRAEGALKHAKASQQRMRIPALNITRRNRTKEPESVESSDVSLAVIHLLPCPPAHVPAPHSLAFQRARKQALYTACFCRCDSHQDSSSTYHKTPNNPHQSTWLNHPTPRRSRTRSPRATSSPPASSEVSVRSFGPLCTPSSSRSLVAK